MIKYFQHLEAIHIHRTYLDDTLGQHDVECDSDGDGQDSDDNGNGDSDEDGDEGSDDDNLEKPDNGEGFEDEVDRVGPAKRSKRIAGSEYMCARSSQSAGDKWAAKGDVGGEGSDDSEGEGGSDGESDWSADMTLDANIHYPTPILSLVKQPTRPNVRAQEIVDTYGAHDFVCALSNCLASRYEVVDVTHLVTHLHSFPMWHRLTLQHCPLLFAPLEPLRCNVVHA